MSEFVGGALRRNKGSPNYAKARLSYVWGSVSLSLVSFVLVASGRPCRVGGPAKGRRSPQRSCAQALSGASCGLKSPPRRSHMDDRHGRSHNEHLARHRVVVLAPRASLLLRDRRLLDWGGRGCAVQARRRPLLTSNTFPDLEGTQQSWPPRRRAQAVMHQRVRLPQRGSGSHEQRGHGQRDGEEQLGRQGGSQADREGRATLGGAPPQGPQSAPRKNTS